MPIFDSCATSSRAKIVSYLAPRVQMFGPVHNILNEAIVSDEMARAQVDFAFVQYFLGIRVA